MIGRFDATAGRVSSEPVNALGAMKPFNLSGELKDGLSLRLVRAEGQAQKAVRVVVKR